MGKDYFIESKPFVVIDEITGQRIDAVELTPTKLAKRAVPKYISRIPLAWHQKACNECAFAVPVANLLWYRSGVTKNRTVTLPGHLLSEHGITKWKKKRSLDALKAAGLVNFTSDPGRATRVQLVDG